MTREGLRKVYLIDREIEMLEKELDRIRQQSLMKSKQITGMPFANTNETGDPTQELALKILSAQEELSVQKIKLEKERLELLHYIYSIEDPLLRLIVKYRCVDCLGWQKIADMVGYERTSVSKKFNEFARSLE